MSKVHLLFIILLLSSCSTYIKKIPNSPGHSITSRIHSSDTYRQARRNESLTFSLSEKELYFLQKIQKKFIIKPEFLLKRYHFKDDSNVTAYIDETSLYLAYLALKAQHLEINDGYTRAAKKTIKGIYYLDSLNKLDGYLPRFATLEDDRFIIGKEPIRTNSYSILFFSYFLAYNAFEDKEMRKSISDHVELIIKYFLKNDLALVSPEGEEIKYSNLKSNTVLSRKLDALVIFEVANSIIEDESLRQEISKTLKYFKHKKYMNPKQIMKPAIGSWNLASPSSHWLNMMKLYILVKATHASQPIYKIDSKKTTESLNQAQRHHNYEIMFKKLYNQLKDSENTLFTLLYGDLFSLSTKELDIVISDLQNFPLSLNDHEIINSSRGDINLKRFPKITKTKRYTENTNPLPIYDRPLVYFEWKRNQHRVDGNFLLKGNVEYAGLDFLIAYALLPIHKISSK